MFKNFPPLFPNSNFVPAAILFFFCTYHGRRIRFAVFIIRRVSYRRRSIQRIIFNFLYISAINTTFLPFSPIFSSLPPCPFFLYLSVIPKTDSFQWKKIGKESPQRYEGQGSRRIRGQEFFRRELRRWRKFGHANGKSFGWGRGIIGSTGWSEAADNYTDIDGSMMGRRGSRISKGRPRLLSCTVSVSLFLFLAAVSTAGGNVFHRVVKLLTSYLSRIRVARSWNHRFVDCRIKKYIT